MPSQNPLGHINFLYNIEKNHCQKRRLAISPQSVIRPGELIEEAGLEEKEVTTP